MDLSRRILAVVLSVGLAGCFGYNSSAKRWSYVGNSILIAGGGAAIGLDLTENQDAPCMGDNCTYHPSIHGAMIAGVILVVAGVVGIVINATRDNVKTSR